MDPSSSCEDGRSLPMSKWMRRHDHVDFFECAASPPSDGFFYANHSSLSPKLSSGCDQPNKITSQPTPDNNKTFACNPNSAGGVFKTFAEQKHIVSSLEDNDNSSVLNMDSKQLQNWAKTNIRSTVGDECAPTPVDSVQQYQRIPSIKMEETERGSKGHLRLGERLLTPDGTPYSTPNATPSQSPLVTRKAPNPFFTGMEESRRQKAEGNWLFRPGPKTDNVLYEAKVEIQPATGTQPPTKNIRYVPKPSKLRDLNFFSPTSM